MRNRSRQPGDSENGSTSLPPREEPWGVKLLFVAAFLASAAATFAASAPLADWVKSTNSELFRSLLTQAIIGLPVLCLVYFFEERLIWRLLRQHPFDTIHPVSIGVYVGYVIHYAM